MPILAIALLRLTDLHAAPGSAVRIESLEDGSLLHTGASFALEPAELSARVRALLGNAVVDRHTDARGIFFLPDVAAPSARSYPAVIEEIGEGGVWGPLHAPKLELPDTLDAGNLAALLGQTPASLLDAVRQITDQDPNALRNASQQLQALIGQSGADGVGQLLSSAGIDVSALGLQQLVAGVQQELSGDPNRLLNLAQSLLGPQSSHDENEDDENDEGDDQPKR